jgi:PIN domain nuclease of toxin-antitoxin system
MAKRDLLLEVMVKAMKGNVEVGDPRQWWSETLDALGCLPLVFRPEHIAGIYGLPSHHADPFDPAVRASESHYVFQVPAVNF